MAKAKKQKLSAIVKDIPKKWEVITGDLYRKSRDPEKKCGVCALGGIALTVAPERFIPRGREDLRDKCHEEVGIYDSILLAAGLKEEQIHLSTEEEPYTFVFKDNCGDEKTIFSRHLDNFIYKINDNAKDPIKAVSAALRKYGL